MLKHLLNMSVLTLGLTIGLAGHAAEGPEFKTQKIAEGLYVVSGVGGFTGGNILISTGDDGTVMIDDSMPPLLDKLRAAIADISGDDIEFLINTHLHDDHTGNNAAFATQGSHIVAHEKMRSRLKLDAKRTAQALPVITLNDQMNFYLNDQPARVFHLARAHTDGDLAIEFSDANVLHTGDVLFNGMFPFIDLDSGGSVDGYIAAQKTLLEMVDDNTVIVPGHGALAKKADLQRANKMLMDARQKVAKLIAQGETEKEILAANPLAEYHDDWSWDFITTEKMTRTLYRDLTAHRHASTSTNSTKPAGGHAGHSH
ncbi:MBL fold metallo-hydrolase [Gilvimarinus japonicus]|uniref:MBL fold metallo-hydrolase n=1 Tax=Gilvimarinus japonicus TaxID=1796469 RepID=A0ABV7HR43_9GAMM